LATVAAIRETAEVRTDLRWPNDVLVGLRKVGGILVEAGRDAQGKRFAVVGIGINVHQRGFDGELATLATSLDMETGRRIEREPLLGCLLKFLQQETLLLADDVEADRVAARVEAASTWVCGRRVEVHGPQACTGTTAGLDRHGFLRVETRAGTITVQTGGIRAAEMS
jgi:BirA family biotin operon repressor/biotin-[acetyl-CoA-carboxylase] ligase